MKREIRICECCGQVIVDYTVTLTKRNLIWLYALGWLGKYKHKEDDYWVNYKEVHELVARHFGKTVDGKWKPMVVSSYSKMADSPWELIESNNHGKEKFKSQGEWRLTENGVKFINNMIQVPELAKFNASGCYESSRLIYAKEVKNINFQELTDKFNSF